MRSVLVGVAALVVALVLITRPRDAHTRAPKPGETPELPKRVPAPEVVQPRRFNAPILLRVFVMGPDGERTLGTTPCTSGVEIPEGCLWGVAPVFPNPGPQDARFCGGMQALVAALRGTGVRVLSLSGCRWLRDRDLAVLAELTELEWLDLTDCRGITGEALAHLTSLHRLSRLDVSCTSFGDVGMAHLAAFPRLRNLDLTRTRVSARGLVHLPALRALECLRLTIPEGGAEGTLYMAALPRLESLTIWGDDLSPAGVSHLRGVSRLRRLVLAYVELRPETLSPLAGHPTLEAVAIWCADDLEVASIEQLRHLPALRELAFHSCNEFTDEHFAQLGRIEQLEELTVDSVTDAGMQHLGRLERLKALDLDDAQITDAGACFLANLRALEELMIWDAPRAPAESPVAACPECSWPRDWRRGPGTPHSAEEPGGALALEHECG